ncbi:hypothetical protein ACJJIE_02505 [Microbulbifer sp. TRSA001]|uniref:hypothetical protein n=1 Tax=Microbulbifer sp. TRSA001 TaxID=3243381 RepID=UPI0040395B32
MKPVKTFHKVMQFEAAPDIYGEPKCDRIEPKWAATSDGEMGVVCGLNSFDLEAKNFPPGTKVVVSVPCCPECGQEVELCRSDDSCDFDWDFWVIDTYQ